MAELITIARPYAKAAFEYALKNNALANWSDMLGYASVVASDEAMIKCLDNPQLTSDKKAEIFISVCADKIDAAGKNFVRQLSQNKRLAALPEIFILFSILVAEQEKTVDVTVQSAYELDDTQVQKLVTALKQRLGREVNLQSNVDASLIGGLVIRTGDMVIDGSIRGKLAKLNQQIG